MSRPRQQAQGAERQPGSRAKEVAPRQIGERSVKPGRRDGDCARSEDARLKLRTVSAPSRTSTVPCSILDVDVHGRELEIVRLKICE